MKEIVLKNKKNGMAMLLLIILLYLAAVALMVLGSVLGFDRGKGWAIPLFVLGVIWVSVGWLPVLGLKVLKPQEALVLTLFGKYVGTLKEEGFYFVNPFCVAVNPAAKTKLNQSGDVDGGNNTNPLSMMLPREGFPPSTSPLWLSFVLAAGFTDVQKGLTQ